jgi:hypothetical protein
MMEPSKDRVRSNISESLDRACVGFVVLSENPSGDQYGKIAAAND